MRIAATIQQQLLTMTRMPVLMSWGIEEFAAVVYDGKPALRITVHARLFQGDVIICLNGAWKIQCKLPPKTKRFCPLVLK